MQVTLPCHFEARKSFKHTWVFFVGMGLFFVGGIIAMFYYFYPGLAIAGFFGGILAYLLIQVLAWGSRYAIMETGIRAQRLYKTTDFFWERIRDVILIKETQAPRVCLDYQHDTTTPSTSRFRAANRLAQLIEFCTVNIIFTEQSIGDEAALDDQGAVASGEFILLTTIDHKSYLFSPKDPLRFLEIVQLKRKAISSKK